MDGWIDGQKWEYGKKVVICKLRSLSQLNLRNQLLFKQLMSASLLLQSQQMKMFSTKSEWIHLKNNLHRNLWSQMHMGEELRGTWSWGGGSANNNSELLLFQRTRIPGATYNHLKFQFQGIQCFWVPRAPVLLCTYSIYIHTHINQK